MYSSQEEPVPTYVLGTAEVRLHMPKFSIAFFLECQKLTKVFP